MQSSSEGRQLVLEFDSPLEKALDGAVMAMVIVGVMCLLIGLGSGRRPAYPLALWGCLPTFLGALLLGWIRHRTRIQYLLDPQRQQLLLRRRIFSYEALVPVANFDEMECLTLGGKRLLDKWKLEWEQASFLILKNGKRIRISNYNEDSSFGSDWREAPSQLAGTLEIPFIEWADPKKRRLLVRRVGNQVVISHVGPPIHPYALILGLILSLAALSVTYTLYQWGPI